MNRNLLLFVSALLFVLGIGLGPVVSQEMGDEEDACAENPCAEEDPGMAAYKKLHAPGEAHELLEKLAGDWDAVFKVWMMPGAEPETLEYASSLKMAYGGRFVKGEYDMTDGPFPHAGEFWLGHDNERNKYQYIRLTDMSTNMRIYEGDYDDEKRQLTLRTEYELEWDGKTSRVKERNLWTWKSDDEFTLEVFSHYLDVPGVDGEFKEVEITYTRAEKKAPATRDPHGVLKKLQGDFEVEFKIWTQPGADPVEMSDELTYDWTLDGQHIVMEYDASDMEMMPHKGIEYVSYNQSTGEYESIRLTSLNGAMLVWKGTYDAESKTLEFKAEASMEVEGETISWTSRAVYEWVNDDKYTCVVYSKYQGMEDEVKEVDMTFTRKK